MTTNQTPTTINGKITRSELMRAYNHLRAQVRKLGDVKAMERLNRAFGMLQSHAYSGESEYTTTTTCCTCKDWEYRNAKRRGTKAPCKHQYAAMLVESIMADRQAHEITNWIEARAVLETERA